MMMSSNTTPHARNAKLIATMDISVIRNLLADYADDACSNISEVEARNRLLRLVNEENPRILLVTQDEYDWLTRLLADDEMPDET